MAYVIFDLDGTVIDSSHRHATLPDGSLDLAHWRENATPEKIFQDGLLPLANSMRSLYEAGHHIIVCTARSIINADLDFMENNRLHYAAFLSRPWGDTSPDADLKERLLCDYFTKRDLRLGVDVQPIMFDDNLKVVYRMIKIGVHALDATKINRRMAKMRNA